MLRQGSPWLLALITAVLTACGGGGGDRVNTPAAGDTSVDATQLVPTPPASTLAGTAAVGAPIVGGQVSARCLNGSTQAVAPTDAVGAYSIALRNLLPPCLVRVSGGTIQGQASSLTLHSHASAAGVLNLTPLTELTLARASGVLPSALYSQFSQASDLPGPTQLNQAWSGIRAELVAMGLSEPTGSPFNTPLSIGDDNDQVLDALGARLRSNEATLAELTAAARQGQAIASALQAAADAAQARRDEEARLAAQAQADAADTVAGIATDGSPLAQALVRLKCQNGTPQSGVRTDNDGRFAVRRYQAALPCLIQVESDTKRLHGWIGASGETASVSAWSELVLARALAQLPAAAAENWSSAPQSPSPQALSAAASWLNTSLAELSLPPPSGSPLVQQSDTASGNAALSALLADKDRSLSSLSLAISQQAGLAATVLADKQLAIRFTAVKGNQAVRCNQLITGLGARGDSAQLTDFRFYVSEAQLIRADGTEVPLTLGANSAWQHTPASGPGVTLIDLEDGSGRCGDEGDADTNALLTGTVPAGRYVGIRMVLGVPYGLNHTNAAQSPAPLDVYAMDWNWMAGRKFAKIEVSQPSGVNWRPADERPRQPTTFYVHLGSTGCEGTPMTPEHRCTKANRGAIHLPAFDSATQNIAVDIEALFAGTDLSINQGDAAGCMSAGTDLDCLHIFEALGIGWQANGQGSGLPINGGATQTVFRAVNK